MLLLHLIPRVWLAKNLRYRRLKSSGDANLSPLHKNDTHKKQLRLRKHRFNIGPEKEVAYESH